jgi:hypothetical protein
MIHKRSRNSRLLVRIFVVGACFAVIVLSGATASGADAGFTVTPTSPRQGQQITLSGNVLSGSAATESSSSTTSSSPTTSTTVARTTSTTAAGSTTTTTTVAATAGTLPCSQVIFESGAFAGLGTDGTLQTVVANVAPDGTFSQKVTLSDTIATGGYTITATCGSTPIAPVAIQVNPLLPLSESTFAAEQLWALLSLVVIALVVLVTRAILIVRKSSVVNCTVDNTPDHSAPHAAAKRAQAAARKKRPNVLAGADHRISTSKCIALLWTGVVLYGVLTLGYIAVASGEYRLFTNLLGSFPGVYLVLLGGPFAAAVGAKAVMNLYVPTKVQKPPAESTGLFDLIGDDNSNVDLIDTQYTLFNVVAVAVVLAQFIHRPGFGAPDIPWFLATLTGASAGTYLANKALASNAPKINQITPQQARVGQQVSVFGTNLALASAPADATTEITVGGVAVTDVVTVTASQITFVVPAVPVSDGDHPVAAVVVKTNGGGTAVTDGSTPGVLGVAIVADAPAIDRADPNSVVAPPAGGAGIDVAVIGQNLFAPADLDFHGKPSDNAAGRTISLVPADPWNGDGAAPAPQVLARKGDPRDRDWRLVVTIPAETPAGDYRLVLDPAADGGAALHLRAP